MFLFHLNVYKLTPIASVTEDPARPEVAESINKCHNAGIRVIMITGDARDTAVAIARDVNILPPASLGQQVKAYEGREFFEKLESEQLQLLSSPGNMIFCRAEPSDKQKLIKMLQSLGEISAMTGDGVVRFLLYHSFIVYNHRLIFC